MQGQRRFQIPVPAFNDNIMPHQLEMLRHFDEHPEIRVRGCVWHRRARKTSMALNLLIRESGRNKDHTYNYLGPTFRQAKAIAWLDPNMLRKYLPREALRKDFNETELRGDFKSGSVLHIGGADDPDRWRGTGGYGWVLDEYATMRNGKMLYEEIIYPIIKENGGWVLFLYTPKGRNQGWEYFNKAKDKTNWKFWFLPATESGIFTEKEIEEIRKEMPEQLFAQEFMCKFLEAGGGIIKRIDEAKVGRLEKPLKTARYVMGVDLGKKKDWTVLIVIDRAKRSVVAFERFQKIDWSFQKERIARFALQYNNALVIMDSTGIGDPIEDDLKQMGLSVRGFQFTSKSKKQLIEKMIVAIEDRRITYPDIPELIDELKDFDIDERGRYSAPVGLHDDCLKKGVLIKTVDGYVPIEDIETGNKVLTHIGRYKTVEKCIKKPFNNMFYRLHFQGQLSLELSYNHPLYCASGNYKGKERLNINKRQWVFPKDWKKGYRQVSIIENLGKCQNIVLRERDFYSNPKQATRNVLKQLKINGGFSKFLGLFLAEGCCHKTGIYGLSLAGNKRERFLLDEMRKYLDSISVPSRVYTRSKQGIVLEFNSKLLWYIMNCCYDKNREKQLPYYSKYLGEEIKSVLDYWLKGDGWERKEHNQFIGATTSKSLALSMKDMAFSIGRYASIRKIKRHRYEKKTKDQYWVTIYKKKPTLSKLRALSSFEYGSRIRGVTGKPFIKEEKYQGDVYNLQVADDRSFIADGIVVHNCVISLGLAIEGLGAEIYSKGEEEQSDTYLSYAQRFGGGK